MNISFDEFKKMELKVGTILSVERIEGADKLLKLQVDFGLKPRSDSSDHSEGQNNIPDEKEIRQIVSGIAEFFVPENLVGRQAVFVVNLEPRMLRGVESQGMILATRAGEKVVLLRPDESVLPGAIIT